jgi:hypothetical protein
MAFYNRFGNNNVEAFSDDVVFTAFSKTDVEYREAGSCTGNGDYKCTSSSTYTDCTCYYKAKVDEFTKLKNTYEFSKKSLDDGNEIYSSVTMDTINLGIGILIMVATISYMN